MVLSDMLKDRYLMHLSTLSNGRTCQVSLTDDLANPC